MNYMKYGKTLTAIAMTGAMAVSGSAFAAFQATATADLNIRGGPGPHYPVIGVIGVNEQAQVEGCLEQENWCQVTHDGTQGWSSASYLAMDQGGQQMVVGSVQGGAVPTVSYNEAAGATAGAAGGAIIGALVGGPVGAAVGGAIGAGVGAANPPQQVRTYVQSNQPEPVYLEGEVVVGAGVPQEVTLRTIPDYDYHYAVVNGQTVLIDPQTRQIVYVYR
jgi:uncharacterized protein YraI